MADLRVAELTEGTWPDLEALFGPNGAQAGCWCTWFFQSGKDVRDNGSDANHEVLHGKVLAGEHLGLIAYDGQRPVGWVAVAPRPSYARLAKAQVAATYDDVTHTWSVTCFFIHRTARRRGVAGALLAGAVEFALRNGARAVEGYPVDPSGSKKTAGDLYHGTLGMFTDAGFALVERRGIGRALVRLTP